MAAFKVIHIDETSSTNDWLREHGGEDDTVVWTDYQTAGRGSGTNTWESERGKNLLFSVLYHPKNLSANRQFVISMTISVALCRYLTWQMKMSRWNPKVCIKWPNDLYLNDRKVCGILIENRLSGSSVRDSIIGVGLNVNQTAFESDAPNPVSIAQVFNAEFRREVVLEQVLQHLTDVLDLDEGLLREEYSRHLYRRTGFFRYRDAGGEFEAELKGVEPDGRLVLCDAAGRERRYAFKEVSYIQSTTYNNHGKIQEDSFEAVGREPDGTAGLRHRPGTTE